MLPLRLDRQLIALVCKVAPGGFSGERIFEVKLANGNPYRSLAPRQFCWNSSGNLVEIDEPKTEVDGMIAARIVDFIDDDQFMVEIPDGETIAVDKGIIKDRPTDIKPPMESAIHVSV
ncbi:MAG: hypothetical protein KME35_13655 [Aphanocapsa sp. GSE-SYN-MK-11-07L]|jgi:hypothetical protein|nr:hypothetical protein [Aphanocapsa sp. GSE-SYN-MK-11-07L]